MPVQEIQVPIEVILQHEEASALTVIVLIELAEVHGQHPDTIVLQEPVSITEVLPQEPVPTEMVPQGPVVQLTEVLVAALEAPTGAQEVALEALMGIEVQDLGQVVIGLVAEAQEREVVEVTEVLAVVLEARAAV